MTAGTPAVETWGGSSVGGERGSQSALLPCVGLRGEGTATHMTQQSENSRGSCAPTGRSWLTAHVRSRPRPVLRDFPHPAV